jgi:hypothetical protein
VLQLVSTSDQIYLVTRGTAALAIHAAWMDSRSAVVTPGRDNDVVSTATETTVVDNPPAGTARDVKTLSIANTSTFGENIQVVHTDGVTPVTLLSMFLAAGETAVWSQEGGWRVILSTGAAA